MFRHVALFALILLPCSLAQVSEDFEKGWDQTAWPTYAPDTSNGGGKVTLDSTVAHSGKNSMRVDGAGGYGGHMFFGTTKIPSGDVYVRTYLQTKAALPDSHVTLIAMPDSAQGGKKHLRLGDQMKVLAYNRESDDVNLPDLSPQGIAGSVTLPVGTWQCIEYHLSPSGGIETWFNNKTLPALTTGGSTNTTNSNAAQWQKSTIKPKITAVYFGWESYGDAANTMWYDDIVVSSSRIGCPS